MISTGNIANNARMIILRAHQSKQRATKAMECIILPRRMLRLTLRISGSCSDQTGMHNPHKQISSEKQEKEDCCDSRRSALENKSARTSLVNGSCIAPVWGTPMYYAATGSSPTNLLAGSNIEMQDGTPFNISIKQRQH